MAVYRSNGGDAPTTTVARVSANTVTLSGTQDVALVIKDDLGLDKTTIMQRIHDILAVLDKDFNDVTSGDSLPVATTSVEE